MDEMIAIKKSQYDALKEIEIKHRLMMDFIFGMFKKSGYCDYPVFKNEKFFHSCLQTLEPELYQEMLERIEVTEDE